MHFSMIVNVSMAAHDGMMSDEKKKILKINFKKIVDNLTEVENVLDILLANEIISSNFMEVVLSKPTKSEKNRELILNLYRYGDIAFNGFLVALEQTNQIGLARQIYPNYSGQDETDTDYDEIRNIKTYNFDEIEIKSLLQAEIHRVTTDNSNYKIKNSGTIGRAVIINNRMFDFHSTREGSEVDVDLVEKLLRRLKFDVRVHQDLTFVEIYEVLHKERNDLSSSGDQSVNIFVLFLMSHGARDYVYGTDGVTNKNLVSLEKVQEIFDSDNCLALKEKPKLFFVQACQRDRVILVGNENPKEAMKGINFRNVEMSQPQASSIIRTHKSSDFFVMISTVPGYLSWRHPEKGSFFIRTLVYTLAKMCGRHDFLSMMTAVQRLLTGIQINAPGGTVVQQPELRSTLRKKLYFLP